MTLSLASATGAGGPSVWIAIIVAIIAAVSTIVAATVAAISARSSKRSEIQAQRISELEGRISERKYEIYKPMIEMFADALNTSSSKKNLDSDEVQKRLHDFFLWVTMYGSDEAVIAYHRVTQGAFNDAPVEVTSRLYVEFFLAARRDIGRSDTQIGAAEIIGMKVTDLYTNSDYYQSMTEPLDEVCRRYNWVPPWTFPDNKSIDPSPPS